MTPISFEQMQWNRLLDAGGWTLIHVTWLLALIALVYQFGKRRFRSPVIRYRLGCLCLIAGATALPITFLIGQCGQEWFARASADTPTQVASVPTRQSTPERSVGASPRRERKEHRASTRDRNGDELSSARGDRGLDDEVLDDVVLDDAVLDNSEHGGATVASEQPANNTASSNRQSVFERFAASVGILIQPTLPWLVVGWSIGVVVAIVRPVLGWRASWRHRRRGVSPASESLEQEVDELARRLRIRRKVGVALSDCVDVPVVTGIISPLVLIPTGTLKALSGIELSLVLRHELAHIRRRDLLTNLVQVMVESVYCFHPAVWWLSCEIRIEREHCCDDEAFDSRSEAIALARALLHLEENRQENSMIAAVSGGQLSHRIARLVGVLPAVERHSSFSTLALAAFVMLAAAFASMVEVPTAAGTTTLAATSQQDRLARQGSQSDSSDREDESPLDLAAQRQRNEACYQQNGQRLREEHAGEWMVIVNGEVCGPFESIEEAFQHEAEAEHRFIYRPTIEDEDFEYGTSPWLNNDPSWYQFGRVFAIQEELTISAHRWARGGNSIETGNGRVNATLSGRKEDSSVTRSYVVSGIFPGQMLVKAADATELGLSNVSIPAKATELGSEVAGEMAWCRVRVPDLEIDRWYAAVIIPRERTEPVDNLIDQEASMRRMLESLVGPEYLEDLNGPSAGPAETGIEPTASSESGEAVTFDPTLPEDWVLRMQELKAGVYGGPFEAMPFWYFARDLMRLSEERRLEILRACASSRKVDHQTMLICRMVFRPQHEERMRGPRIGSPITIVRDTIWESVPLHLEGELPVLVVYGYALAGVPEAATSYLDFCEQNCRWTTHDYLPKMDDEIRDQIERFLQEDERVRDAGERVHEFVKQQYPGIFG